MDIKKFIVPTTLENSDKRHKLGDRSFDTRDLVYLDNIATTLSMEQEERVCYPTDYAVLNGALMSTDFHGPEKRKTCRTWLRSASGNASERVISFDGSFNSFVVNNRTCALRPSMQLNLPSIISARESSSKLFKIDQYKVGREVKEHTIEFGEYPQTYVGKKLSEFLEQWMSLGAVKPTGKKYIGPFDGKNNPIYYEEYEFDGQRYVRVENHMQNSDSILSDGTKAVSIYDGDPLWVRVEPIIWKIRNWEDMPTSINPAGTGKAKVIDIQTNKAIMAGIHFHPYSKNDNIFMWQNSTIRGFLNGYNVNNLTDNGKPEYATPNGGNFSRHSFLSEAFSYDLYLPKARVVEGDIEQGEHIFNEPSSTSSNVAEHIAPKRERKGYGIKVLDKPMSINEQIKFYIDNGKSFMLHGPSGVGKTRRIEEADPDFVSIVLRNGILPEEVIGKTIYPNNDKTKAGTWVPPAWYVDLCEKCEREPNEHHVLFIDEITNVKPSEQSLVFHLVLNNSIGPNVGELPDNVVVVAAGNSKEESESAYNMPEPLFRRFDGHIELRPDVQLWLEWGSEQSDKDDGRLNIHPIVSSFVGSYGDQVFYSPYDSEEPPKYAIDPRGWEQVSDIIYDNKGLIARELIENKVGKEIATNFVEFAKNPPLMLEDILDNNYNYSDIPTEFDAQYALALSLRSANIEEVEKVREFIYNNLGAEILSMFDVVWASNDDEKAIYLASLPKLDKTKNSELYNWTTCYPDNDPELPF